MTPSTAPDASSTSSAVAFLDPEAVLAALRTAAARLRAARPEVRRVLLFGSRADRRATARSDADLVVVVDHAEDPPHLRPAPYLLALSPTPVPVDLFVLTEDELDTPAWRRRLASSAELGQR